MPTATAAPHNRARPANGQRLAPRQRPAAPKCGCAPRDTHGARSLERQRHDRIRCAGDLVEAKRVPLHRPHPTQQRPSGGPTETLGSELGVDDREGRPARPVEARRGDLRSQGSVGAGDHRTGGCTGSVRGCQTAGVGVSERLQHHHFRQASGIHASQMLRQIEPAEREAVQYGQDFGGPASRRFDRPNIRFQHAAGQPTGRGAKLIDLRGEGKITHERHPNLRADRRSDGDSVDALR